MTQKFHPKEINTYIHIKMCKQIFRAALFTIAKTENEKQKPQAGAWEPKD